MSVYYTVTDNIKKTVTALTLLSLSCPFCYAQTAPKPLDVRITQKMDFGSYIRIADSSSVVLNKLSRVTVSGLKDNGGKVQSGMYEFSSGIGSFKQTISGKTISDSCAEIVPTTNDGFFEKYQKVIGARIDIQNRKCQPSTIEKGEITGSFNVDITSKKIIDIFPWTEETYQGSARMDFIIRIKEPDVVVTEVTPLNFGAMLSSPKKYKLNIDTNGNISGNTEMRVSTQGASVSAGKFTIAGPEGTKVTMNITQTSITLTSRNNEKDSMRVTNFLEKFDNAMGNSGIIKAGGSVYMVGGTLNVGANQPSGIYEGTYTININY